MSGTYLSKIPVLVVALVIGIVLVTSAVVPLASDYSDAKIFKNEGYYDMRYIDTTADVDLSWDAQDPHKVIVNDETIELPTIPASRRTTIVAGDSFIIRYYDDKLQWTTTGGSSYITEDATFTASGGNCNMSWGTSSVDKTYTSLYIPSSNGPLVMKKYDESVYMNGDSEFVAIGTSDIGSANVGIKIVGSIEDGAEISTWKASSGAVWTFSNITITNTPVDGYKDLYKLSTITADATDNSEPANTGSITYSYYMVPLEVTADPDNPVAYKNLVKVVPLMAFIMLVVAAAGMVYFKNRD